MEMQPIGNQINYCASFNSFNLLKDVNIERYTLLPALINYYSEEDAIDFDSVKLTSY